MIFNIRSQHGKSDNLALACFRKFISLCLQTLGVENYIGYRVKFVPA